MSTKLINAWAEGLPATYPILAIIFLVIFYNALIYPLFISPLRNVPGPKLAALSSLYINIPYYKETAIVKVKSLHDRYGSVVRVGPNELVIDDPKQLSLIYGVRSTFPKPGTAVLAENHGFPNSFSSVTREDHRNRRQQVAKVYTMNSQLNNEPLIAWIRNRVDVVKSIFDKNPTKPVDIFYLAGLFATDVVSHMVYGESLDLLGGNNLVLVDGIRHVAIASCPTIRFAWLFTSVMTVWPLNIFYPNFVKKAFEGQVSMMEINQNQINRVNAADTKPDPERTAIGCMQAQSGFGKTLTEGHIKSECLDHVLAGADTTAASMAYMFFNLALPENREYQEKLRKEVLELSSPLDFKEVCNLPYLNICVLELLRLHAPGPGSLQQRVTPANEKTILESHGTKYELPPGTMVGIQAHSLHRNEEIFGERPDKFRPKRWETANESQMQKMKQAWIPFGTGARLCLGMSLATMELKVLTASILREYTIETPTDAVVRGMVPIYGAVIRPQGAKCDLIFKRIASAP
ncbi:hypothetical protein G7Z17_g477 [Cylindrodendrum hubeiense]|uniref:Cytochrome P450 n=1 Tax=Cylindrodendrum hubeiense TaxID=595255 RepID=A0A9P5LMD0_9HYPO|nr:hypothetical protein G7Z17_g477 [Cylindrodendrum hubeiense]